MTAPLWGARLIPPDQPLCNRPWGFGHDDSVVFRAISALPRAFFIKGVPVMEVSFTFFSLLASPSCACPALNYRLSSPEGGACNSVIFGCLSLSHLSLSCLAPPGPFHWELLDWTKHWLCPMPVILCFTQSGIIPLGNGTNPKWHLQQGVDASDLPLEPGQTHAYYPESRASPEFSVSVEGFGTSSFPVWLGTLWEAGSRSPGVKRTLYTELWSNTPPPPFFRKKCWHIDLHSQQLHSQDTWNDAHLLTKASVQPQRANKTCSSPHCGCIFLLRSPGS